MKIEFSNELKKCNYYIGEIEATYHDIALKLKLTDSGMRVLYTICEQGEDSLLQDICRYSGLSKQTVNSAIRKLEHEGTIYLENVSGKAKKVYLTEQGQELVEKTVKRMIKMEDEIFESWDPKDVENYLLLQEKYTLDLKKKASML